MIHPYVCHYLRDKNMSGKCKYYSLSAVLSRKMTLKVIIFLLIFFVTSMFHCGAINLYYCEDSFFISGCCRDQKPFGGTVCLQGVGLALSCCHGYAVFTGSPLQTDASTWAVTPLCVGCVLPTLCMLHLTNKAGLLVNVVCSSGGLVTPVHNTSERS